MGKQRGKQAAVVSFQELWSLLGKRADDPAVLAFHRSHDLEPPSKVTSKDTAYPSKLEGIASLDYTAEIRLPGYYPPRREGGAFVGYLSCIEIWGECTGDLPGGLSRDLPLTKAKQEAKQFFSGLYEFCTLYVEDTKEIVFCYDADTNKLDTIRLAMHELPENSPELAKLAAAAKASAPKREPRAIPERSGTIDLEAMPPALVALADEELGEIDLEVHSQLRLGGPKAWSNNPAAEYELREFAQDGSGGIVAFWLVHEDKPLEAQPVVFLGSEGTVGAVACDLADFLYLLAGGVGPLEAIEHGSNESDEPLPAIEKLALKLAKRSGRTPVAVLTDAAASYGDITDRMAALNMHR